MKTAAAKVCFLGLFGVVAAFLPGAEPPSPGPQRFSAHIGGFLGGSYSVELHGDTLSFTSYSRGHSDPKHKTITPTAAQWREFRQTLDDLKVWQWRAEYPNHGTLDGTQWALDIAYADRALHTQGDNNYPDESGKPNGDSNSTKVFNRYLAALQRLLGDTTFQ